MNLTPEFMAASDLFLRLADTLGMDHPDTERAMLLVMALAPQELKNQMTEKLREMGLLPEAFGYLEDGTPLYRLEDVAERLGLSPENAEVALQATLAEREASDLSNAGVVNDAARIHRKQ